MADLTPLRGEVPRTTPRWSRLWIVFSIGAAVGLVLYTLLPPGIPRDLVYQIFGLGSAAAIVTGVRIFHPARPWAWYLMAAGQLIWSVADAVGTWDADIMGRDRFPSPADPVYLIGYPVVAAGLILLIRGRRLREDLAGLLDSAILTVALGVLSWVLLARPTIETFREHSEAAALIALAYPVADIVLAAVLIRLVTTPGGRSRSFRMLVMALALMITADTIASAFNMLTYDAAEPINYLWMASYAAWGAAALEPSMTALTEPAVLGDATFSRKRLVALTVAVLVAPGTLTVQQVLGTQLAVWAVVIGSVTIFLLVIARINLSITQIGEANEERELARIELAYQAAHDALTGLPNRTQGITLIRGALSRAQRSGAVVGVLFLDLDGFKQVNDTYGHQAGDEVLTISAQRMHDMLRAGDMVARLGGDEFVVLLEPIVDEPAAVHVAERLVEAVAQPISLASGRVARIGTSIGVAINSDGGTDPDRLLQEADHAVYRAKAAGRGRVEVFASSLRDELARRTAIETAAREALRRDVVALRRDPVVDLASHRVIGYQVEPLLEDSEGAMVSRELFLDVTQGTELGFDLDAWVLRQVALEEVAGIVLVHVTPRHLADRRILTDLTAAVEAGVHPRSMMLVVPASQALDDMQVLSHLAEARRMGVRTCGDGFGGASPTNRWSRLPFDYVRLDARLLVAGGGPILLRLTVETAHAFGYRVVAPDIRDEVQAAMLKDMGCELGQGPLFEKQPAAV